MKTALDNGLINRVLSHFNCSLENSNVSPLGNGLINHTYLVKSNSGSFVLQKINEHVFKSPEHVVQNADLIHQHLSTKQKSGIYSLNSIGHLTSTSGDCFVRVDNGFWRAIEFIPNCYTVEQVDTTQQAHQAATAFAKFSSSLSDFSAQKLHEIIPNFHNLSYRLEQLKDAVKKNGANRLAQCQPLVDFIFEQSSFITAIAKISQELPVRVTHNDTKINNLLFSSLTQSPIAVIDLDTCMPGFIMNDFGDMVRTCCSNLPEDAQNINDMQVRFDIFEALAQGYISTFGEHISTKEKYSLVLGAQLLPFMIGIRFLTDYLDGDFYFHIEHEKHNFDRANNQLNLYRLLNTNQQKINDIVMHSELTTV